MILVLRNYQHAKRIQLKGEKVIIIGSPYQISVSFTWNACLCFDKVGCNKWILHWILKLWTIWCQNYDVGVPIDNCHFLVLTCTLPHSVFYTILTLLIHSNTTPDALPWHSGYTPQNTTPSLHWNYLSLYLSALHSQRSIGTLGGTLER